MLSFNLNPLCRMKNLFLTLVGLTIGGQTMAQTNPPPATLPGNQQVEGGLTVGSNPPASTSSLPPSANNNLTVNGWSHFKGRAIFENPAAHWTVESTGGSLIFYPAYTTTPSIQFSYTLGASFPGRVTIGNVASPGSLGVNNMTLAVGGNIGARGVFVVAPTQPWPDYVFGADYDLRPLAEVAEFVRTRGHLPDVPPAATVQAQGLNLGEMDAVLLRKVEELTLYLLELKRENEALKARVQKLER